MNDLESESVGKKSHTHIIIYSIITIKQNKKGLTCTMKIRKKVSVVIETLIM